MIRVHIQAKGVKHLYSFHGFQSRNALPGTKWFSPCKALIGLGLEYVAIMITVTPFLGRSRDPLLLGDHHVGHGSDLNAGAAETGQ